MFKVELNTNDEWKPYKLQDNNKSWVFQLVNKMTIFKKLTIVTTSSC